jgi:hypothetical protein
MQPAYRRPQPSCLGSWIEPPCRPSFLRPEALEQILASPDYSSERARHSRNFVPGSRVGWRTQLVTVPRSLQPANLQRCLPRDLSPSMDPGRGLVSRPLDCRLAQRKPRLMPDTGRPALTGSDWTEPVGVPLADVVVGHPSKPFAPANMGLTLPALRIEAKPFYAFDHSRLKHLKRCIRHSTLRNITNAAMQTAHALTTMRPCSKTISGRSRRSKRSGSPDRTLPARALTPRRAKPTQPPRTKRTRWR